MVKAHDAPRSARALPLARIAPSSVVRRLALALLLATISLSSAVPGVSAALNVVQFDLAPNATVLTCFRQAANVTPTAHVTVTRGAVNDTLEIVLSGFKPSLAFDLFTVQNSNKLANGSADPAFTNFGLAWYQSDIEVDSGGHADVTIQTILLDQIFGFDPAVNLAPTNTFHVGFWFNNPADAAPCGFDVTKPTPFNGDHNAGPLAMISLPNATTGKGPLFTVGLTANGNAPAAGGSTAAINSIQFDLAPNGTFLSCFRQSANVTPSAHVTVTRGALNDTLEIVLNGFKPNTGFDLFTVQNSPKRADGSADPAFVNFGLAWYQSDIEVDGTGHADVTIRTILLDQIFGFDPAVNLAPTNTFHVGFWFDNPADAAPCGFDVTKPTPFNGDHNAGPLAMISLPNAATNLGPLSTTPAPQGLEFFPLSAPVRLLDTRGLHAFKNVPTLGANQTVNLPGHFTFDNVTVPSAAVALVGNATVDNSSNPVPPGFATVFPSGQNLPGTSTLNFVPGTVRPNEITVGLGADGTFNLFSSTGGNFIIDITGYYAPPATGGLFFHPLSAPVRLLDTRGQPAFKNVPTLGATQTVSLPASFTFNGVTVPGGALALVGNATVDNSSNPVPPGFATIFPGGQNLPATSTLNFVPGTVAPNAFTVGIGTDGTINLFSSTGGNFVIDIVGYYDANGTNGLEFTPLSSPVRELDTRGQPAFKNSPKLTATQTLNVPGSFTFNGVTIPPGAKALLGNATVDNSANPVPPGFATIFPGGTNPPLASNLNFVPGTVAPNAFVVGIGTDGTYNLFSSTGGNFILDISGFFSAGPETSAVKASVPAKSSGGAPQPPAPANTPTPTPQATAPKPSPAPASR
jgi:hypothetical protein